MPGLSATNDFIPGIFPQACGHFVNFFVHDCFGEEGGFPVRGDFVVPAIPGSLIGRLVAQVPIMGLDPPDSVGLGSSQPPDPGDPASV